MQQKDRFETSKQISRNQEEIFPDSGKVSAYKRGRPSPEEPTLMRKNDILSLIAAALQLIAALVRAFDRHWPFW